MDYKLSIVIPHYNSIRLLEKLLDSIPCISDIQIIVVDDQSPEDVKEEYRRLSEKFCPDNYFFLENKKEDHNAGIARNIGLDHVHGEWVLFADSDDYFIDGFYEIVSEYFDKDYDIVFFEPTSLVLDTGKIGNRHLACKYPVDNYVNKPCHETEMILRTAFFPPWSKLIRTKMLKDNNLRFDETKVSNDEFFSVAAGLRAKKITASNNIIYCVTKKSDSLTTRTDLESFELRASIEIKVNQFLQNELSSKDYNIVKRPTAYEYLYRILKRKYGLKVFKEYFDLFAKNHMLTFSIHWIKFENIRKIFKSVKTENNIEKSH